MIIIQAFQPGDEVKLLDDEGRFRDLQKKHGGWVKRNEESKCHCCLGFLIVSHI